MPGIILDWRLKLTNQESKSGLSRCNENIKGFIGKGLNYRKTADNRECLFFDVSFGLNKPEENRFATWRHCIAYGKNAALLNDAGTGSYVEISGWVVTNPVYGSEGIKRNAQGEVLKREYLIVENAKVQQYEKQGYPKQLGLVATDA